MRMQDTFYKLLGMAVWNGGRLYLRRRYGPTYVPSRSWRVWRPRS